LENLDGLFRDAKRIKPHDAMWTRIAAGAAAAKQAGAETEAEPARHGARRGWRLAATFAIGVGALAALLVTAPGTGGGGSRGESRTAQREGMEPMAVAAGQTQAGAEGETLDDVLDWHADLGEGNLWDDDVLSPLLEE
jgi:hypothetical protein